MSFTHGSPNKRKQFDWNYDPETRNFIIINQNKRVFLYSLEEIHRVMIALYHRFSMDYFPLSNNISLLGISTEKPSLGTILLEQLSGDIDRAQGASYLGVLLEECGYLKWNGRHVGIAWCLIGSDLSEEKLAARISAPPPGSRILLMAKRFDWTREEFDKIVTNPTLSSEALAAQLPKRSANSVQLIREGVHAFHTGMNTSMLSELMLKRLEDSRNEITCPVCGTMF